MCVSVIAASLVAVVIGLQRHLVFIERTDHSGLSHKDKGSGLYWLDVEWAGGANRGTAACVKVHIKILCT